MSRILLFFLAFMMAVAPLGAIGHPSLFTSPSGLEAYRRALSSNPRWQALSDAVVDRADSHLGEPMPVHRLVGRRMLDVSRNCMERVMKLSYAWLMTGDSRYASEAERIMLTAADFTDWNPEHFLDTAEMTVALATGYDWLYDVLKPESREKIASAILEKGIRPALLPENRHIFVSEGNWSQVSNAALAVGAAALADREPRLACEVAVRTSADVVNAMAASYAPDGVFPEGPMYAGYGTSFNIMLIEALRALPGGAGAAARLEKSPGFAGVGRFMLHTTTNSGRLWPYGDCQRHGNNHLLLTWFASHLGDPGQLYYFMRQADASPDAVVSDRYSPAILLSSLPYLQAPGCSVPTELCFFGSGAKSSVATLRSGWKESDIYAALKGGSAQAGHAHLDAGSVVVEKDGLQWLTDPGMIEYPDVERYGVDIWNEAPGSQRWDVFLHHNLAHSTLTFDGRHPQRADAFARVTPGAEPLSAIADLSGVYADDVGKASRTLRVLSPREVSVVDSITTPSRFTMLGWTAVTEARAEVAADSSAVLLTAPDGRTARLALSGPFESSSVSVAPLKGEMPYDSAPEGLTRICFSGLLPRGEQCVVRASLTFPD